MYKNVLKHISFEYVTENMIVFKDIYEVEDVESEIDFKLIEEVGEEAFIHCGMKRRENQSLMINLCI